MTMAIRGTSRRSLCSRPTFSAACVVSAIAESGLGNAHPDTLEGCVRLAQFTYSLFENEEDCEENFGPPSVRYALRWTDCCSDLADGTRRTLEVMQLLADLRARAYGGCDEAVSLYMQVIEARKRTLGPRHHYTLELMESVAALLEEAGDDDAAASLRRKWPLLMQCGFETTRRGNPPWLKKFELGLERISDASLVVPVTPSRTRSPSLPVSLTRSASPRSASPVSLSL